MNIDDCVLIPLTAATAEIISKWEYSKPYDIYNFKGHPNGYLMDEKTWGVEQYALCYGDNVIGQVACQFDKKLLWVGWSLAPELCGKGNGYLFVLKCINEIRKVCNYTDELYLRVAASNKRAIKAYEKAGFKYSETVIDEVAYTNVPENFWIMTQSEKSV